jgi:hypothetical protein
MCPQQSFNHTNNTYLNVPIWRTVSFGSKKVMCTQCRGELSVNEAFEFLRYSENVTTDNLLSLQRDMVELNFLLNQLREGLWQHLHDSNPFTTQHISFLSLLNHCSKQWLSPEQATRVCNLLRSQTTRGCNLL